MKRPFWVLYFGLKGVGDVTDMHSGRKYVVIIVFKTTICQLFRSDIYKSGNRPAWLVDGMHFVQCVCVCVCTYLCLIKCTTLCTACMCMQYTKWCVFCVHWILCPRPCSILISYCPIVYISSTYSVCHFKLFTFFRERVIHCIYKYNLCLFMCVYVRFQTFST